MAETVAQLRGGGLGEGRDQQLIHRRAIMLHAMQTALDKRLGLARAGAGHDQHIAPRRHGALLDFGEAAGLDWGGIHALRGQG